MTAVQDYASLSQALQDYWVRTDIGSYVDYFIQAAQDTIDNDILTQNEGRGVSPMETTLTGDISGNTLALPSGYLALKNMQVLIGGNAQTIQRKNMEFISNNYPYQKATAAPAFVARVGSNFVFAPYPDSAYAITGTYWAKTPILSASQTTNWLTISAPTLLLNACNMSVSTFLRDDQAFQLWQTLYQQQLQSLLGQYRGEEWSGSALTMTPA